MGNKLMNNEIIRIERYNHENEDDYKEILKIYRPHYDFYILEGQAFIRKNRCIFLMIRHHAKKFLCFNTTEKEIIGYCIIENAHDYPNQQKKSYLVHLEYPKIYYVNTIL